MESQTETNKHQAETSKQTPAREQSLRTLYLMRHGETLFNAQHRIQAACDSPLTDAGIEQARCAGRLLKQLSEPFDHFYCSTCERASDTLELVMGELYGELRPYERMKGLKEPFMSWFEGQASYLFPRDRDVRGEYAASFGGESDASALLRVSETLTDIMSRDEHECVLCVSHGCVMELFMRAHQTGKFKTVFENWMPNCTILVFTFNPANSTFVHVNTIIDQQKPT